jgi:hypothetical protein
MEGPVEFSVLSASTDHGTGQFCLSGKSQSPKLPFFRPCPQRADSLLKPKRESTRYEKGDAAVGFSIDKQAIYRYCLLVTMPPPGERIVREVLSPWGLTEMQVNTTMLLKAKSVMNGERVVPLTCAENQGIEIQLVSRHGGLGRSAKKKESK